MNELFFAVMSLTKDEIANIGLAKLQICKTHLKATYLKEDFDRVLLLWCFDNNSLIIW